VSGAPRVALLLVAAALATQSCGGGHKPARPQAPPFEPRDEIIVAGERIAIGTPIVVWDDPIGFDAHVPRCRYSDQVLPAEAASRPDQTGVSPLRFGERSKKPRTLAQLAEIVHLVVIHYDAVGSAERCFRALHDNRGLSAHFLLDLDGTLYQTLDLVDRAFHAKDANDESIGIEIANIGAMSTPRLLQKWYGPDESGAIRNLFPPDARLGEQRRRDFVPRPARKDLISGTVHGRKLVQYDFTNEQYDALAKLVAALARVFPRVHLEVPRDRQGKVVQGVLPDRAAERFEGLVGHYHLDEKKDDPGPAFDWDRVLSDARRIAKRAR
jgi:N-acetyl-anhydromuramyl-L-alanine amidase AmpD